MRTKNEEKINNATIIDVRGALLLAVDTEFIIYMASLDLHLDYIFIIVIFRSKNKKRIQHGVWL
jgi:hypothetical protein